MSQCSRRRPLMENTKMCPITPLLLLSSLGGQSPRGTCLAQKVKCLVSHLLVSRGLSLLGQKDSQSRKFPKPEDRASSTTEGSVRVSPLWDPSPVSFESAEESSSIQSANTPGWLPCAKSIRVHAEMKRIKTPPPMVQSLAS